MTEIPASPPTLLPAPKRCWKKKVICILGFVLILVALALTFYPGWNILPSSGTNASLEQRLKKLEGFVLSMDMRLTEVEAASAQFSNQIAAGTNTAVASPALTEAAATEMAQLRNDMASLTSAMTALQTEVKQTGSSAVQSQQSAQASLAAAIAYIQLRQAVTSGQAFAEELAAMRISAKGDVEFEQLLAKLDAFASQGIPTTVALHKELLDLEASAAQAVDKSQASTLWERMLAELKGLISIRKLQGGTVDAFPLMETALAKNDIKAALNAANDLPEEAKQVLISWRQHAETRIAADEALRALAARFTTPANPPQAAQP